MFCPLIRGNILNIQERYDEVIKIYKQAIVVNPNNETLYNNLGDIFSDLNDYEEAIESY